MCSAVFIMTNGVGIIPVAMVWLAMSGEEGNQRNEQKQT